MINRKIEISILFTSLFLIFACSPSQKETGFNLFTLEQDRQLGAQVEQEILNSPDKYPILDSARYPKPYQYLYEMRNRILNSGNVIHKDEFRWKLYIIKDDNTKNAFCTPGGYIYIYTGLIKYLNAEDQLAGVLAHEIGHADYRHSTRQMTKQLGVQILLDVIAGDRAALKQVTGGLVGLKFSRDHEREADKASVHYLCPTDYDAAGGAKFFEKIQAEGGGSVPEFLSTHPSPENRIEFFYNEKLEQNCKGSSEFENRYQNLISSLP
ncbi:MAG: M48 family metalloprotease [Brumimicrobium sp.]|nr:M48 family metalloprotease [Brumimicrobium sp.]